MIIRRWCWRRRGYPTIAEVLNLRWVYWGRCNSGTVSYCSLRTVAGLVSDRAGMENYPACSGEVLSSAQTWRVRVWVCTQAVLGLLGCNCLVTACLAFLPRVSLQNLETRSGVLDILSDTYVWREGVHASGSLANTSEMWGLPSFKLLSLESKCDTRARFRGLH